MTLWQGRFQSTRPVRGATRNSTAAPCVVLVSIHAPRAGRDTPCATSEIPCGSFNPRAPCGARRSGGRSRNSSTGFNPRAPCGARPTASFCCLLLQAFQSTRPVRGATSYSSFLLSCARFQSTRPVRGATDIDKQFLTIGLFQSTRPVRGATRALGADDVLPRRFNPRAPCGARRRSWSG